MVVFSDCSYAKTHWARSSESLTLAGQVAECRMDGWPLSSSFFTYNVVDSLEQSNDFDKRLLLAAECMPRIGSTWLDSQMY